MEKSILLTFSESGKQTVSTPCVSNKKQTALRQVSEHGRTDDADLIPLWDMWRRHVSSLLLQAPHAGQTMFHWPR